MLRSLGLAVSFALLGPCAQAQVAKEATRGELLYTTHCIACHSTQMHWREKKLALDWPGLTTQVRRWQQMAGLGWSQDDIAEVARYLNTRYYHYAAQEDKSRN